MLDGEAVGRGRSRVAVSRPRMRPWPRIATCAATAWRRTREKPAPAHAERNEDELAANYRADVRLNGEQIGDATEVVGTYRVHEFDVTNVVARRGQNHLALQIHAPREDDLAITWAVGRQLHLAVAGRAASAEAT